jgi:NTP pyrophosphatase (non-canonical NTP hydrolase)
MFTDQDKLSLKEAIARWGTPIQFEMVIEECTELTLAIQHYKRGRGNLDAIMEEVADVQIMIGQMEEMLCPVTIARFRREKLDRLRLRLDKRCNR